MMVLNHSVGPGSARTSFNWFIPGFREGSLMRRCLKAWGFACIAAKSSRFGLKALRNDCSQLTSELQGIGISAEACANA